MAATKKTQKTIDVWKKKRWHRILSPKVFNEQIIGETPALEPDTLVGRTIAVNLATLARDMKRQGIYLTFEVGKVMGDTAFTYLKKYEMMSSSIKRLVRRNRDRIDDSFLCTTADNVPVRVKPFLLTRNSTKHSIGTALRRGTREFLSRTVRKLSYDVLIQDIVTGKLQRAWRDTLKNIYPLKICDIRVLELELGGKRLDEVMTTVQQASPEQPPQEMKVEHNEPEQEKKAKKIEETPQPEGEHIVA